MPTESFEALVTCLQNHLQPKPTIIAERYKFHQRNQNQGETVADYLAALRRAAAECQFAGFLEEALRDRFVCGLASEPLRRRLLLEKELSLRKATEIAVAMETADKDCKTIEETKKQEAVNALYKPSKQNRAVKPTTDPCYRCGRKGHQPQNCRFREAQCHNCGKTGHIAVACRNKTRSQKTQSTMQKHVELDSDDDEEEELSQLNNLKERDIQLLSSKPLMEVRINGQRVEMEIDTGAAVSVISQKI